MVALLNVEWLRDSSEKHGEDLGVGFVPDFAIQAGIAHNAVE